MFGARQGGRFLGAFTVIVALAGCTELTKVDWTYIERAREALGGVGAGGEPADDAGAGGTGEPAGDAGAGGVPEASAGGAPGAAGAPAGGAANDGGAADGGNGGSP